MELRSGKTTELTITEKQMLCDLFSRVFLKPRSITEFDNKYLSAENGFSFHSFILEDGLIIGSHSVMPVRYRVFG